MKTLFTFAIALSFLGLAGGTASAQPKPAKPAKVKEYDFSKDTIEGDILRPDGTDVTVLSGMKHSSLIKIRQHFIPEILKSAEDL
ncbi:MAG: hypothetical protein IPL79_06675 [Myxococcales bacterium]|nr:hypothetical protein [Myxococcales bacterium]